MYRVDIESKKLLQIKPVKFADLGVWERLDIQEWISKSPEILGEGEDGLLILYKELPVNDDKKGIRLDLLALDRQKNLVVIELKRDDARGDVDWQSIKYAARVSRYEVKNIIGLLAEYSFGNDEKLAKQAIVEHIEGYFDEDSLSDEAVAGCFNRTSDGLSVRIILVSREFHPDVAAAALWLRENQIDISCVRIKPFQDGNEVFLVPEKIIPLPETAHYTDSSTSRKKISNGLLSSESSRKLVFSMEKSNLSNEEVLKELQQTLKRPGDLTPRLKVFLEILSESEEAVNREEMKDYLFKKGIGKDIGQSGRYLSNISQFLTKPNSGHLRQLIDFQMEGEIGAAGTHKKSYQINKEYRELVKEALSSI